MACPRPRPFRFLQREKIVLGEDQPMLFQFHVMITNFVGGSLSFAATAGAHSKSRFRQLSPFPIAGLRVVAGGAALYHFVVKSGARHDERGEIATGKAGCAGGEHDDKFQQRLTHCSVLIQQGGGKRRADILAVEIKPGIVFHPTKYGSLFPHLFGSSRHCGGKQRTGIIPL